MAAAEDDKYGHHGGDTIEKDILLSYTERGYGVNYALRDGNPTEGEKAYIRNLDKTLDKEENYSGVVYRGVEGINVSDYAGSIGSTVKYDAYTSTSKDSGRAESYGKSGVVFVIQSRTGKDIESKSSHSYEKEVLFKRNTEFIVERVEGNKVHLKEKGYEKYTRERS